LIVIHFSKREWSGLAAAHFVLGSGSAMGLARRLPE